MHGMEDQGDEEFYDRLDSSYPTDDDDTEVKIILSAAAWCKIVDLTFCFFWFFCLLQDSEGDEAYLGTYDNENDGEEENDELIHNLHLETNFPFHNQQQESGTVSDVPQALAYTFFLASRNETDEVEKADDGLNYWEMAEDQLSTILE